MNTTKMENFRKKIEMKEHFNIMKNIRKKVKAVYTLDAITRQMIGIIWQPSDT